jgi:hypothetical protein
VPLNPPLSVPKGHGLNALKIYDGSSLDALLLFQWNKASKLQKIQQLENILRSSALIVLLGVVQ